MARPKKQPAEARRSVLQTRVTEAEFAHVQQQAVTAGLTVSDYVRQRTLKGKVTLPRNRSDADMLVALNRVGVSINMVAHAVNRGGDVPHDFAALQHKLYQVLEQVGRSYDT